MAMSPGVPDGASKSAHALAMVLEAATRQERQRTRKMRQFALGRALEIPQAAMFGQRRQVAAVQQSDFPAIDLDEIFGRHAG